MGEFGHLPTSARSGIKIAQFGPDFDIDIYHQTLRSVLDKSFANDHDLQMQETQNFEDTSSLVQPPKLGFQISMTSNTTQTVFEASGYYPPSIMQHVVLGKYRGGRKKGQNEMVQV